MDNKKQDLEIEYKLEELMKYSHNPNMTPMIVNTLSMYEREGYDVSRFKEMFEINKGRSSGRN